MKPAVRAVFVIVGFFALTFGGLEAVQAIPVEALRGLAAAALILGLIVGAWCVMENA